MKIKLNVDLLTHKKGQTINVPDKDGIPLNPYWRKRLKDSKIDNCIEVVSGTSSALSSEDSKPKRKNKKSFKYQKETIDQAIASSDSSEVELENTTEKE